MMALARASPSWTGSEPNSTNCFLARQHPGWAGLFNSYANQFEGGPGAADVLLDSMLATMSRSGLLRFWGRYFSTRLVLAYPLSQR